MSDDSEDAQKARRATDGDIDSTLGTSAPEESFFRDRTALWIGSDYLRAMRRCDSMFSGPDKREARETRMGFLRELLQEWTKRDALGRMEEEAERRHGELKTQLQRIEAKVESAGKPHWTTVPTFWIVAGTALATLGAVLLGLF